MNSSILAYLGLGNIDSGYILIGMAALILILFILVIVFIAKERKLSKKYNKFMMGKDAKSLEEDIVRLYEDNSLLKDQAENNKRDIKRLYKRLSKTYQKLGIVKYDAYQQMGGLLSFSLALLDENNDGFVLNSIHSTEGCYLYTKEITNGESKIELGNEERVALDQAMK